MENDGRNNNREHDTMNCHLLFSLSPVSRWSKLVFETPECFTRGCLWKKKST
jgi:hypothetical protein